MGPCILEIHEIRAILVKFTGFAAIWPNKFLSGEFCVLGKNDHYLALGVVMEIWR